MYDMKNSSEVIKMKLARKGIEGRLDAALKIAREAFKGTKLTMKDIDNAVKSVRRKAYGKKSRVVI